jgi:hypothetical protein
LLFIYLSMGMREFVNKMVRQNSQPAAHRQAQQPATRGKSNNPAMTPCHEKLLS